MADPSHALLEKLIDRRLQSLQAQLHLQHGLLLELVHQLPRHALLQTAQMLERETGGEAWHLYLCQLAGVVDGRSPPQIKRCHDGRTGSACRSSDCL